MHRHVGQLLSPEILGGQRAGYGEEIVVSVLRQLTADYGHSFSAKILRHIMRFAEVFQRLEIGSTLLRKSQALSRIAYPEIDKE
jgi:hypothetical protein